MDNDTFIFKRTKSIPYYISSTLVLIFGVYWIQYFLFGGIVISVGSIFFVSSVKGFQLDFENRKYRETRFIGSVGFGQWKDLPEVRYLSVFKVIEVQGVRGLSNTLVSSRNKVIQLNLIHGKRQKLKIFQTEEIDEAFNKAKYVAKKLNLRIYDATTRNAKWYDD